MVRSETSGSWFAMATVYVTGTDTGVGKSLVAATLLYTLRGMGLRACGMKPVASGCRQVAGRWRNEDADLLQAASTPPAPEYGWINPYALPEATAPEIAATQAGVVIELDAIRDAHHRLQTHVDWVVVEGVGGWMAPISKDIDQVDVVAALGRPPLILVVGVRLGCINHARLSVRAALADHCSIAGWVANVVDADLKFPEATLAVLHRVMPAPCLGVVGFQSRIEPSALAGCIVAPFAQQTGLSSHSHLDRFP